MVWEMGYLNVECRDTTINGLKAGTYYLHEIAAPEGYNKLAKPVTITISG